MVKSEKQQKKKKGTLGAGFNRYQDFYEIRARHE